MCARKLFVKIQWSSGVISIFLGLVGGGVRTPEKEKKRTLLNVNICNSKVEEIRALFFFLLLPEQDRHFICSFERRAGPAVCS